MSYFAHSDELPGWAAQVPDDWGTAWLKWSVDLCTKRPTESEQESLPYISNEDVASWTGKLLIEEPKPAEADSRVFQKDDVLFNKLRPYLAKVYHARFDGVSSGELLCLRPSQAVEPRFLFYVLVSKGFIDTINSETFGSKMPRADWEIVGHQPLPLPPLEIQRRIARFLDERTARIDGLIERKRSLLERLAEKRQALITRAVTKGLNPDAPMKPSGIDWLGDIPAHWSLAALGYRYEVQLGRMLNAERADGENLKPYLRVFDVQWGKINTDNLPMMDFPPDAQERYRLCSGDLLVNEGGSYVGRSAIWRGELQECYYQKALHRLRPFHASQDTAEFFYFVMEAATKNAVFVVGGNQTTIDHLTAEQLKRYRFGFPPIDEQLSISTYLLNILGDDKTVIDKIDFSIQRLNEYRSAIITAAVTGQIAELQ